ncbi:MAG: DUF748 domain-containing protein [Akkermansiaceae bacterium]
MKKWLLRIFLLLIVITIAGFFFAKSYLTRDYIVAAIEKSINSRVQVKDIDVNLYGLRGTVDLNEVIITQRDESADQKTPHDDREPIEKGDIFMKSASFNISIWEILSKKILVEKINFDGVTLNLTLYEEGDTSIEKLFAKPNHDKSDKQKKFNAKENEQFITTINEITLTNVDLNLIVDKTQLAVEGRGVNLHLLDIDVNPKQLDTVNDAKITLQGTFDIHPLGKSEDYGKIVVNGESDITLFNTENGDLEPDMVLALTIGSDSYLTNKVPVISKISQAGDLLKKFLKVPEKLRFKNDQSVRVSYKLGISTLLDPLSIKIEDWKLQVLADSWIGSGNDMHFLGVKLYVGEAISSKLGGFLSNSSAVGGLLGKLSGGESLLEDGKLTLHLESSGELSKPKIRMKNKLAGPAEGLIDSFLGGSDGKEDPLREAGKDLLKGFLK